MSTSPLLVENGHYAVGVSGGADSVALLLLLHAMPDLSLHVVHLNHQTRGPASEGDADFVGALAKRLHLPCTIAIRSEVEAGMTTLPANPSARYRAVRLRLFKRVVSDQQLNGVMLAHHADDQAETVLQRLIRGSGLSGLAGMTTTSQQGDLRIYRPLLGLRRDALRDYLTDRGEVWREDESNTSADYTRNVLRGILKENTALFDAMILLAETSRRLRDWARDHSPELPEQFSIEALAELPEVLGQESAKNWLIARGSPPEELTPSALARLVAMAQDAAAPARQDFPGKLPIRRRAGKIWCDRMR